MKRKPPPFSPRTYSGYKKLLFIHTGCANDAAILEQSREMAALLALEHSTTVGDSGYLEKIINGPWEAAEFIHIPPGDAIDESWFTSGHYCPLPITL